MAKIVIPATFLLYVASYLVTGWSIQLLSLIALATVTVPLVVTDIKEHRLPNSFTSTGFIAGLGVSIILAIKESSLGPVIHTLSVALLTGSAFLVLYLFSRGGMGMGDVKLAIMLGALIAPFGWPVLVMGFIVAFILGGACGLILLVSKKANRKTLIPFGPYLLIGAWVSIFFGANKAQEIINLWSINS